jgi:hypothetical protein
VSRDGPGRRVRILVALDAGDARRRVDLVRKPQIVVALPRDEALLDALLLQLGLKRV